MQKTAYWLICFYILIITLTGLSSETLMIMGINFIIYGLIIYMPKTYTYRNHYNGKTLQIRARNINAANMLINERLNIDVKKCSWIGCEVPINRIRYTKFKGVRRCLLR